MFDSEKKIVCVQGLGFVGSAMAVAVANSKDDCGKPLYNVIGIDIANEEGERKVEAISKGVFPFENNDTNLENALTEAINNKNLFATTDESYYEYANIVIVDVNLDVFYDENNNPYLNLDPFKKAIRSFAIRIKEGTLVIVETTVPPGTCEKVVLPIINEEYKKRGLDTNKIFIAHSYERVMPGKDYFNSIINYWRVYSGINDESADRCRDFLETVISTNEYPLTRLKKTTASEISKVLENSYRATTIAFMEEWGRFAEEVGVDLFEVVDAIRLRPTHTNMRQPGFGVGGYCLTKDPFFAKLAAKDLFGINNMDFPFSTLAVRTNNKMPLVSLSKIESLMGGNIRNNRFLIMGVSYRQDVGDTRYSPTEIFYKEAIKKGAIIDCQDPFVKYWKEGETEVINTIPDFSGYDVIVFAVQHKQYSDIDFETVEIDEGTLIFDSNCVLDEKQRNALENRKSIRVGFIGR